MPLHPPVVHALGVLNAAPEESDGGPVVAVRLTLLREPVPRAALLADSASRDAEVLRMPTGSNSSWLSAAQFAAVRARIGAGDAASRLGRWDP